MARSILRVGKYRGKRVFEHGQLRFNCLPAWLPAWGNAKNVAVWRGENQLDSADVKEYGTHGATDRFFGFWNITPEGEAMIYSIIPTQNVVDPLKPEWLEEGDRVVIPCHPSKLRSGVLSVMALRRSGAALPKVLPLDS